MTTPQINTKVELVVEAIEGMMHAVISGDFEAVACCRQDCADALREFLRPVLRVAPHDGT